MGQLRKEVDALLTEDQRQALEAKMQRMMKRMEKRMEQRESMHSNNPRKRSTSLVPLIAART